ncbi:Josephin-2 [Thelohanellus kitauei]|uniref:ubiquitinyl hydrolase 1 n=1 Tax=Thelohanellus kitauei TaxID=669202 RepID=A0A0C2IM98_THEKT|nr:Josephin-2 [Thelohanellus kitauei]
MKSNKPQIYHEKQSKYNCAIHALNNIFQRKEFDMEEIEKLADILKREHNIISKIPMVGYYDINLIEYALKTRGCETKWLRNTEYLVLMFREYMLCVPFARCKGLIVNSIVNSWYSSLSKLVGWIPRHWLAIANVDGEFYDLDSNYNCPVHVGNRDKLVSYLMGIMEEPDNRVIVVYEEENKQLFEI